jgi:eukaryotic-like serine/threonine-protein kinase
VVPAGGRVNHRNWQCKEIVKIGRYEIVEEIGRGAMGVVYRAHDPNLDIDLALKVLRKDRTGNEPFVRRFMAEARALGRLDHPEIVRVFNVERDGEDVYIAMELIAGVPISSRMKEQPCSTPATIADFALHMAQALDYAHKKGIIHRDVKPSNILYTASGFLKITDFGIARIEDPAGAEETQVGEILGTPAYMSPEQVLGRQVDGRSDLFSLGIILYEMATGSRPFQGQGMSAIFNAITNLEPAPVHLVNPDLPRSLSDVIMKCLSKSPQARHADGRELAAAVLAAVTPAGPQVQVSPIRAANSRSRAALIAGGALAVLSLAGYLLVGSPAPTARQTVPVGPAQAPRAASPQNSARLKAETSPAGATVYLDGATLGVTPAVFSLAPGKHEIVLSLANYDPWEAQVELEKDVETPVTVALTPSGKLR